MATFHKDTTIITVYLFIIVLVILQLSFEPVTAARPPPSRDGDNIQRPPSTRLVIRMHAPTLSGYKVNRYKKIEIEAFRPTTPGLSPGAGHEGPPGSH